MDIRTTTETPVLHVYGADIMPSKYPTPHLTNFNAGTVKKTGNSYTLIQKFYEELPDLTYKEAQKIANLKPGIKPDILITAGVRTSSRGLVWPVKNAEGNIVALYRFINDMNTWISTPRPCSLSIIGLDVLKSECPVWITEGHWDYAALLSNSDTTGISVLGLCGSSWPTKQLTHLESRDVVFLGDNDEAGQQGVVSLAKRMKRAGTLPTSLKYLNWSQVEIPDKPEIPDKFDIRDLCMELS